MHLGKGPIGAFSGQGVQFFAGEAQCCAVHGLEPCLGSGGWLNIRWMDGWMDLIYT